MFPVFIRPSLHLCCLIAGSAEDRASWYILLWIRGNILFHFLYSWSTFLLSVALSSLGMTFCWKNSARAGGKQARVWLDQLWGVCCMIVFRISRHQFVDTDSDPESIIIACLILTSYFHYRFLWHLNVMWKTCFFFFFKKVYYTLCFWAM